MAHRVSGVEWEGSKGRQAHLFHGGHGRRRLEHFVPVRLHIRVTPERQDRARQGKARQGKTRQGKAGQGRARRGEAWYNKGRGYGQGLHMHGRGIRWAIQAGKLRTLTRRRLVCLDVRAYGARDSISRRARGRRLGEGGSGSGKGVGEGGSGPGGRGGGASRCEGPSKHAWGQYEAR